MFYGRIPYNILDIKLGFKPEWKKDANDDLTDELQNQKAEIHHAAKDNLIQSYLKYKRYYDKKAAATPLKVNDYCYVRNPNTDNQSIKFAFKDCIWTGLYIVVNLPSNNKYVVRRTGTRYTQTFHRIRLRLYASHQQVPDVTVKVEDQFPEPEVKTTHNDWYAQACETEFGILFGNSSEKNEGATITESTIDDGTTTENEEVITIADETLAEDKTFSGENWSFNLDVSDYPYIMNPPPMETPQYRLPYRL